jgi:magnesium-transporting ATPase (P-type)
MRAILNLLDILFYSAGAGFFSGETFFYLIQVAILLSTFAIGLILIYKSSWIAAKLDPGLEGKFATSLEKRDWIELALIVVGFSILLWAIPGLLENVASFLYFDRTEPNGEFQKIKVDHRPGMTYALFRILGGLILISNVKKIARFIDNQK